ncbi:MAG: isoprenylcysteine carboxylmethyltransferase family protein [Phycisphaerales bacterium]|nr:isoprenylcysteine carboxylmethyltransferase family protein [Phycisphaerales bacterium]
MTAIHTASLPVTSSNPLARAATLAYGLTAYAGFFISITYAIGFLGNWLVPKSIDTGAAGPVLPSLLINAALLMVFVLQHTIMARPAFKRWFTRFVPRSIERSTFVLAASAALGLIFWQWRPAPQVIWSTDVPALRIALNAVSISGWAIVFLASFMVSHFDLFGLRQTWLRFRDQPYRPVGFRLVGLYKLVRHPLMLGFIIAIWATPSLTIGHLFFAVMVSLYIAMGVWFEERDLVAEHGENYLKYRRSVRALIPLPKNTGL